MEYTEDIILGVKYHDVNNAIRNKKGWTSSFARKIKRHKVITASVILALIFILIDTVLIMNFIDILCS